MYTISHGSIPRTESVFLGSQILQPNGFLTVGALTPAMWESYNMGYIKVTPEPTSQGNGGGSGEIGEEVRKELDQVKAQVTSVSQKVDAAVGKGIDDVVVEEI